MRVTFYGVRGSIATPGLSTVRYGGNTVCVDVRLSDGTSLVLDAGTGIRELGRVLLREGHAAPIHSLITHAHWDHIIELPFFGPIWRKETQFPL
jgi:phosphoribosyl 1,2-cyclic phosphodiesterase